MRSPRPWPDRGSRGRGAAIRSRPAAPAPVSGIPPAQPSGGGRRGKLGLTLSLSGLLLYLWVIHYPAYPLAQTGIIIGLIGIAIDPHPIRVPTPLWWFGAFVLWSGLGYAQSSYPDVARDGFIEYLKLWLIFLLGANVAHERRGLRTLTIAWLALFAFYPVRGTLFNVVFGISKFGRYAWNNIFANPNDLAALTLPMLALCIGLLQTERTRWVRIAATTGAVLLPAIIFFTQSRGGIMALMLFGALVLLRHRKRARTLIILTAAASLVAITVPSSVWSRLGGLRSVTSTETLGEADPEGSAEQRYEIWKVAMAIAADHPVFGTGPATYPKLHAVYARGSQFDRTALGERDTHSTYLNTLVEAGVVGLVLFLGMLIAIFVEGHRVLALVRRQNPLVETQINTLLIGLVAFLVTSLFATSQHVAFLYLYLAIVCTYLLLAPNTPTLTLPPRRAGRRARTA